MKNLHIKFTIQLFTAIFLIGIAPQVSHAQWASASMTAYPERVQSVKSIDWLKKGVLVIRLESKSNNIKQLTSSIDLEDIDPKLQRSLKAQRRQMMMERDTFNKKLISAFQKEYQFSDFVFMMDTSAVHYLDGATSGIFLDSNGKIDPSISIEGKKSFVLRIGKLSSENTTGIEALIVSDHELNDMQKPFPYYINLNHRFRLKGMFSRKGSLRRDGVELVKEIETKFKSFHAYYLKRSYSDK